jgi:hypothetical protein
VCGRDCGRHAAATLRHDDRLTAQPEGLGLGPDSPDGGGGGGGKVEGKVLILGAGWMGSRVAAALGELGEEVEVTHRPRTDIDAKGPYFRPLELPASVPRHAFDLLAPESWDNLPVTWLGIGLGSESWGYLPVTWLGIGLGSESWDYLPVTWLGIGLGSEPWDYLPVTWLGIGLGSEPWDYLPVAPSPQPEPHP